MECIREAFSEISQQRRQEFLFILLFVVLWLASGAGLCKRHAVSVRSSITSRLMNRPGFKEGIAGP